MNKSQIKILLSFFLLSLQCGVIEDKDVISVLPEKRIQQHANIDGVCNLYSDGNYYLYEGEACILMPLGTETEEHPQWQSTQALYNSNILNVYEAHRCGFDGPNLQTYSSNPLCDGLVIMGLKEGNDVLKVTLNNPSSSFSYKFIVINNNDTRLLTLDQEGLFSALAQRDIATLTKLIAKGLSLNQLNAQNQSAIELIAQTNDPVFVRKVAGLIKDSNLLSELVRDIIGQKNSTPTLIAGVLPYIPYTVIQTIDTDKKMQNYIAINGVSSAMYLNDRDLANAILAQGYPVSGVVNPFFKLNAFFLALKMSAFDIAIKCVDKMTMQDLQVPNLYNSYIPTLTKKYKTGLTPLQAVVETILYENRDDVKIKKSVSDLLQLKIVLKKILQKIDSKALLYQSSAGDAIMIEDILNAKDQTLLRILEEYTYNSLSLTPQEIIKHLETIFPNNSWNNMQEKKASFFIQGIKNLGVQDAQGNTALMLAIKQNKMTIAKTLAQYMSFPELIKVNRQDNSALEMAQNMSHPDLIKIINTRIAKEQGDYFYEGFAETCSTPMYIPAIDKKKGIAATTGCLKVLGGQKSGAQEIQVKPTQYVYNGSGTLTVLSQKNKGVLYTAQAIKKIMGVKDLHTAALTGFNNKLPYFTASAFLQLSDAEKNEIDPQGTLKNYVQETAFFAAVECEDEALVKALLDAKYVLPTTLNKHKQNIVMAAFAHKLVGVAKTLFAGLSESDYGQQDDQGKTLIMYVIEAGDKATTEILIEKMQPSDLVKMSKYGRTTAYLLLTMARWQDLLEKLINKAENASLFYCNTPYFTYFPLANGNSGSLMLNSSMQNPSNFSSLIQIGQNEGIIIGWNNSVTRTQNIHAPGMRPYSTLKRHTQINYNHYSQPFY